MASVFNLIQLFAAEGLCSSFRVLYSIFPGNKFLSSPQAARCSLSIPPMHSSRSFPSQRRYRDIHLRHVCRLPSARSLAFLDALVQFKMHRRQFFIISFLIRLRHPGDVALFVFASEQEEARYVAALVYLLMDSRSFPEQLIRHHCSRKFRIIVANILYFFLSMVLFLIDPFP